MMKPSETFNGLGAFRKEEVIHIYVSKVYIIKKLTCSREDIYDRSV